MLRGCTKLPASVCWRGRFNLLEADQRLSVSQVQLLAAETSSGVQSTFVSPEIKPLL